MSGEEFTANFCCSTHDPGGSWRYSLHLHWPHCQVARSSDVRLSDRRSSFSEKFVTRLHDTCSRNFTSFLVSVCPGWVLVWPDVKILLVIVVFGLKWTVFFFFLAVMPTTSIGWRLRGMVSGSRSIVVDCSLLSLLRRLTYRLGQWLIQLQRQACLKHAGMTQGQYYTKRRRDSRDTVLSETVAQWAISTLQASRDDETTPGQY